MLRVLTLSTLFPDRARPNFGVFVERQTLGLAAREGVDVAVAAGIGLPLWPLSLHPHYRELRALAQREDWRGLAVHRPRFRSRPQAGAARALATRLLPLAREFRPDVIDAEFFWPDGVAALHLARALGLPFSIKARGSDIIWWGRQPAIRRQMVEAAEAAGGLLAVSESLRREMIALGMPAEKIRVHYTGIDLDLFRPVERPRGRVIATLGNLVPVKGQRLAIEALRQVPGATLLVIGDGPERKALERAADGRVRFLGAIPHRELPAILTQADVMVLPAEREGLANAWIEALACGIPIIIPDVGGAREVIDRPEAGRIVAREPGAIAAAIRELLDDPPPRQAVRAAAERFSWDRNAAELEAHLRAVSGERH
ncbi:MAG TPA: glycosyltransferase [Allosphingosinicella sp.]|jgi:glycosyltransferase involved in cell wall biosynthesis